MKPLTRLLSLIAFFLIPIFAIAQINYKPGYVVTIKGDTIKGFIYYPGWDKNPKAISFKRDTDDVQSQKYGLNDIQYFNIDGRLSFQRNVCRISMNDINIDHLAYERDSSYRVDTVFLQILQRGKNLTLYSYSDNLKTRYYIGETPAFIPVELEYQIYKDQVNAGETVHENTYQKQLFALAVKYQALDDKLSRTFEHSDYWEPDLVNITGIINGISDKEVLKKGLSHPSTLKKAALIVVGVFVVIEFILERSGNSLL